MITLDQSMERDGKAPEVSDRVFGLVVGALLTIVSLLPLAFGKPYKPRLLAVALALAALGLLCPILLKWPKRIWLYITHRIGLVVQLALLAVIFFLVVTPVALLFRLMGRDTLNRRIDENAPTYWVEKPPSGPESSMANQF